MASEDIYIDSYRLVAKLGSGAFGDVYLAQNTALAKRTVAIKLLHAAHLGSSQEPARFLTEARSLENLKHPYILPVIDFGVHEGFPYLVTEYASRGSLRNRLQRQARYPLALGEAITILSQVGQALQYAHTQDIVHGDLKSENILFNENGEALLADFVIGTLFSAEIFKQKMAVGTLTYMAPEQTQNIISKESDQYALGCIAYEMCTGHMPFPNYDALILMHLIEELIPPKMYNPELPTYIEQAILKAMSKQPTKRHVDVSTFIKVLSMPTSHPTQKTREEWMLEFQAIPKIYPGDKIKIIEACERAIRADSTFADAYFFKGVALDDLKRYEEALANFEHATQLDSTNGIAWLYKGDLLKHFNRLEEAQQAYKIARELGYSEDEELDPSGTKNDEEPPEPFKETNGSYSISVDTFNDEGLELEQKKHYPAALQAYEQAIRLNPNFTTAWRNKAHMLWRLNRYSEALEACEHAIQLNPYYAPVYTVKGLTLHSLNRYEEALTSHEKAIQLDPNIAEAYISKGHVLYELKRFDEALTAYEYTIQLDQSFLAHYGKGLSLSRLECFDEAITAFDQAILLKPNFADAYQSKGVALFNLKRYVQALDAFEHFIQLDPYKTIAWLYKGNILLELNFYNEALTAFEEAVRLNPNAANVYFFKGAMLDYLKRYEEALADFEHATQLDPSYIDAYNSKGAILTKIRHYQEALLAFEQAIRINPSNADVWRNKGKTLLEMERYNEALPAFERAIQLNPKYIDAYNDKGNALNLLYRYNEAMITFEQAILLDPNNADLYNGKGNALNSLNRYNEALAAFNQAIQLER